jgi:hypothetical protein
MTAGCCTLPSKCNPTATQLVGVQQLTELAIKWAPSLIDWALLHTPFVSLAKKPLWKLAS